MSIDKEIESNYYLHDIPLDEAWRRFKRALDEINLFQPLEKEKVPLSEDLVGRILAEPVWALRSSPHYHACAMDGFAVLAADTFEATPSNSIILNEGQFTLVDTGDPLPINFDAVIPIERIEPINDKEEIVEDARKPHALRIRSAVSPWQHVRLIGEDIIERELAIPSGIEMSPADLGAVAAAGHSHVSLYRKPKVIIIPTGDELVPIGKSPKPGEITEFNSLVLAAQIKKWDGIVEIYPIQPDTESDLTQSVIKASKTGDIILLLSGSSAGSDDLSSKIVSKLGSMLVHGIAVRPGHPVILGIIGGENERQVPIIGVPGYPVSAVFTSIIFVKPLIQKWIGKKNDFQDTITAELSRKVTSPLGDDDYMRVAVGIVGNRTIAIPVRKGAGVITSLIHSDGYTVIPRGVQGLSRGEKVKVHLFDNGKRITKNVMFVGSHDVLIDLLREHLNRKGFRLSISNVGSLGGLLALNRGESHITGSHLLDPEIGTYNETYIKKYIEEKPVKAIPFVERLQGLYIQEGNPKSIDSIKSLVMDDVRFINRQPGSGTRALFDYLLEKEGISNISIKGYDDISYTHYATAAAVASGRADVGMGIQAPVDSMNIDFIPIEWERYDLIISEEQLNHSGISKLLEIIHSQDFIQESLAFPGYRLLNL